MNMSQYRGPIRECESCVASRNAADAPERSCRNCVGRGFVATCMACDGKGYTTQAVAGSAAGTMNATCSVCGGHGCLPVDKPEGWVAPEPATKKLEAATA